MFKKFRHRRRKEKKFIDQYHELKKQELQTTKRFQFEKSSFMPFLEDATSNTAFDRHYIYHPAWAARIVKEINPTKHIDISSTLHFCSILSAFIPVDFYDYRPANLVLDNLNSLAGNLHQLPFESNSVESISCMHTVEHVGLGRYGDPIDYDGDLKAINELKRVVAIGGNLLFVVPMELKNEICFNGQRLYNKELVLHMFKEMTLVDFSFIPNDESLGGIISNPSEEILQRAGLGCGCFWFKKN